MQKYFSYYALLYKVNIFMEYLYKQLKLQAIILQVFVKWNESDRIKQFYLYHNFISFLSHPM